MISGKRRVPEKLTPRARAALRLYATGKLTQKQAARIIGIHPVYVSRLVREHPEYLEQQMSLHDRDVQDYIRQLSIRALEKLEELMEHGSEPVQLKAAMDLADRGAETSKVQRHQVASFSLGSQDAKDLIRALLESTSSPSSPSSPPPNPSPPADDVSTSD